MRATPEWKRKRASGKRHPVSGPTLLVTGFERFGAHRVNPSERVVEALAGEAGLRTLVLPVSYARAVPRLQQAFESGSLAGILMLGLHGGSEIRLERVARNRNEAEDPDEDGERRAGEPILAAGPERYPSTLPLGRFAEALSARSLPWVWSDDAGGFLCNHVFYRARAWVEAAGGAAPCGFVHLPPLGALPLERQLEAVGACLEVLRAGASVAR